MWLYKYHNPYPNHIYTHIPIPTHSMAVQVSWNLQRVPSFLERVRNYQRKKYFSATGGGEKMSQSVNQSISQSVITNLLTLTHSLTHSPTHSLTHRRLHAQRSCGLHRSSRQCQCTALTLILALTLTLTRTLTLTLFLINVLLTQY